jgi:hypothetical protein
MTRRLNKCLDRINERRMIPWFFDLGHGCVLVKLAVESELG